MKNSTSITLDGDFVGHPFRGNGAVSASGESRSAVTSSKKAKHAEKHGDPKAQKKAHRVAHHAHMAAAEEATTKAAHKYHKTMAKFHGSRAGMTLDGVEGWDDISLDDASDFGGGSIVGKIMKGGKQMGRAVIAGDGKAMVFVGDSNDQRVEFKDDVTGRLYIALWSDDDAADMVEWLLVPVKSPEKKLSRKEAEALAAQQERAAAKASATAIAEQIDAIAKVGLKLPEGISYKFDIKREVSWKNDGPGDSISFYLQDGKDTGDENKFAAEARIFLDEPRVILFANHGSQFAGQPRTKLIEDDFLKADDYQGLANQIVQALNGAIEKHLQMLKAVEPTVTSDADDAVAIETEASKAIEDERLSHAERLRAAAAKYLEILSVSSVDVAREMLTEAQSMEGHSRVVEVAHEVAKKHPAFKALESLRNEAAAATEAYEKKKREISNMRKSDKKFKLQEEADQSQENRMGEIAKKITALGYSVGFRGPDSIDPNSMVGRSLLDKNKSSESYGEALRFAKDAADQAKKHIGELLNSDSIEAKKEFVESISPENVINSIQGQLNAPAVDYVKFSELDPSTIKSVGDFEQYGHAGKKIAAIQSTEGFGANAGKTTTILTVSGLIEDSVGDVRSGLVVTASAGGKVSFKYGEVSSEWQQYKYSEALKSASVSVRGFLAAVTKQKGEPLNDYQAGSIVLNIQGGNESRGYLNWGKYVGDVNGDGENRIRMSSDAGESVRRAYAEFLEKNTPTPEPTVTPDPAPAPTANAEDRAFFMSLIDGTHPNLDDPELVNNLEAAYQRNSEDAEMVSLFTQAINAYTTASLAETEGM